MALVSYTIIMLIISKSNIVHVLGNSLRACDGQPGYSRIPPSNHSTIFLGVTLVAQPHLYLEQLCREMEAVKAVTIDQIRSDVTVLEITSLSH